MIIDLIIYAIGFLVEIILSLLTVLTSWITFPVGLTDAVDGMGYYFGLINNVLPTGFMLNLVSASAFVLSVNLVLLPIIASLKMRLPFQQIRSKE